MNATHLVFPASLDELKQGIGDAILREGFRYLQQDPPDFALQSGTGKNNDDAAVAWCFANSASITELQSIARRSVAEQIPGSPGMVATAMMSDLFNNVSVVVFLAKSPMGYLSDLISVAVEDEDKLVSLLNLLLELPH